MQTQLFNYIDDGVSMRDYTTYKGLPLYDRYYLLDAIKDAAGEPLANMVAAYFDDIQQQANEQLADSKNDTQEVQEDLDYLTTDFNIAFDAIKTAHEQLGDILCKQRLDKAKIADVCRGLADAYYTLKKD